LPFNVQGATVKEFRYEEFGRPREVQRVDRELFWACMNSRGWELYRASKPLGVSTICRPEKLYPHGDIGIDPGLTPFG